MNDFIFNKIQSPNQAYWLGFLTADGSIWGEKIQIGLATKDIGHLEKFKKFLNSSNKISTKMNHCSNNNKYYSASYFTIKSRQIADDLEKYQIVESKSYKNINFLEVIPEEYIIPYLLGVFDGDGWFTNTNKNMGFGFCGNEKFMEAIRIQLNKILKLEPEIKKIYKDKRSKITYYIQSSSKYKIYKFIKLYLSYKDCCDLLDRKVKTAEDLLNNLETNFSYLLIDKPKLKKYNKKIIVKKSCIEKICPICNKKFIGRNTQKFCSYECSSKSQRVSERPSREDLKNLIRNESFLSIGKKFNVTDNTIRKWCKSMNLPFRKTEINKYTNEEWDKI